jgi:hypothetical protein
MNVLAFARWRILLIAGTPEKHTFWSSPFYAQVVTMGQLLSDNYLGRSVKVETPSSKSIPNVFPVHGGKPQLSSNVEVNSAGFITTVHAPVSGRRLAPDE